MHSRPNFTEKELSGDEAGIRNVIRDGIKYDIE
jgi:hypothetical protein